ncbi:MAG: YdcF family protein [Candidatus Dadabacteria bacterium]|nr:MAG: YdcF family protein [Candidatus Dadabacteria bacterium]
MKKCCKKFALILLLLVVTDLLAVFGYTCLVIADIQKHRPSYPVDAAFVFFNGFGSSNGLSEFTNRNIEHAAMLFRGKKIRNIVCLGGARPQRRLYGAELMKQVLINNGIPAEKVFSERESYDSLTNFSAGIEIAGKNQWRTIVLISQYLHLYRLAYIAERSDFTFYMDPPTMRWIEMGPLKVVLAVHHEWLGWAAAMLLPEKLYLSILHWSRQT